MIAPTKLPSLSAEEARDLTARINSTAGDLCLLLVEAHDRQAWRSLGYDSWRSYATSELTISQSKAYRVLDVGRVTQALLAVVADNAPEDFSQIRENPPLINETAAREIKPVLPAVVESVKERVAAGAEPREAIREAVAAHRPPATEPPAPPAEEPNPDDHDIAAELEHADRQIRELEETIESLSKDDSAREIRALQAKIAQLNANHQGTLRTLDEARKSAKYGGEQLAKIRKALGVERDREILPAIEALRK